MKHLDNQEDKDQQDIEGLIIAGTHTASREPYRFYWIRWWCQSRFSH